MGGFQDVGHLTVLVDPLDRGLQQPKGVLGQFDSRGRKPTFQDLLDRDEYLVGGMYVSTGLVPVQVLWHDQRSFQLLAEPGQVGPVRVGFAGQRLPFGSQHRIGLGNPQQPLDKPRGRLAGQERGEIRL
nr:hypothetical protein [Candidatus Protofrankia californiensis]